MKRQRQKSYRTLASQSKDQGVSPAAATGDNVYIIVVPFLSEIEKLICDEAEEMEKW